MATPTLSSLPDVLRERVARDLNRYFGDDNTPISWILIEWARDLDETRRMAEDWRRRAHNQGRVYDNPMFPWEHEAGGRGKDG